MRSPKGKGKQQAEGPKGGALAFKVLPEDVTKRILEAADPDTVEAQLASFLDITDKEVSLKAAALLDYYVSGVLWSRERGHNPGQLSSVYSVLHMLLENVKPPVNMPLIENINALKALLADIGAEEVSELSGGLELLGSVDEAQELTTYITKTLFQHYSLFQFLFERTPAEDILGCDLLVEVAPFEELPPFPPPLPEGIPEELLRLLTEPPSSAKAAREPSAPIRTAAEPSAEPEVVDVEGTERNEATETDLEAIFAMLEPSRVARIVEQVCREELAGVERDVAVRLREKENDLIARLNKVHKVAPE